MNRQFVRGKQVLRVRKEKIFGNTENVVDSFFVVGVIPSS
jgi:hypothetical protein